MAKITYTDKVTGGQFTADNANEIKTIVNSHDDNIKQSDWGQSDNTAIDYIKNKPSIPSSSVVPATGLTFDGQFNLSANYETSYMQYSCVTNVVLSVGVNRLVGAFAECIFLADGSHVPVFTALGTLWAGSDNYNVSNGKLNHISVFDFEGNLYYNIKVLN